MDMELFERDDSGDLDGLKTPVKQGRVHVNKIKIHRYNKTALYLACENGHTEEARYLLDKGASVNLGDDKPLIAAVRYNHYDCVKLLLQYHADANCTNAELESPMSFALQERDYSIILLLLQYDAIPSASLADDVSTQLLNHARAEHARAVQKLIDQQLIKLTSRNTFLAAFDYVFKHGSVELAEKMLLNDAYWKTEKRYPEAVYYSAKNNWPTVLSKLVEEEILDTNALTDGQTPLYAACKEGHESIVRLLLSKGANPNVPNKLTTSKDLWSPLQIAVDRGFLVIVGMLIENGIELNPPGEPLLHIACSGAAEWKTAGEDGEIKSTEHMLATIRLLLQHGVNVNAISGEGDTALYRACVSQQLEAVQILLEAGADVNLTSEGHYPLIAACEAQLPICCPIEKGHTIVDLLLRHGADVNKQSQSGKSALIYCIELMASQRSKTHGISNPAEKRNCDMLKSMLMVGGDANMLTDSDHNALHIASSFGMCDAMTELIQHGANCNQLTLSGKSALHFACENGHEAAVVLLLKNGAEPDSKTTCTPTSSNLRIDSSYGSHRSAMPVLCTVAKNGSETMVKMLLEYGADVNEADDSGCTALHLATSAAVIEMLLNAGANVNATNLIGETALSVVCGKRQADVNVTEMLLKFGADPDICFLLHAACEKNDSYAVGLFLAYGADANLMKESTSRRLIGDVKYTTSPLCIACKNRNEAIIDCLLANGAAAAVPDSEGNTPLHFAVDGLEQKSNSAEHDPIATLLLKHNAPVNVVSNTGEMPLYMACKKGLAGVVKQLLDCNADANLTTSNSNKYPLMIACERKFTDIAAMMLDRGADANVSKDQQTPLKLAAAVGDVVLVKQLLTCGADVNQMKGVSDTALHVAVERCRGSRSEAFKNIVDVLLKSGAEPNAQNHEGVVPLQLTCRPTSDDVDVVQIMLEHGADPNLHPSSSLAPPLSLAAQCRNSELTSLLIKFGATVDLTDEAGRTALHYAIAHNDSGCEPRSESDKLNAYLSTAEVLLSAGANVNAIDRTGATPLYFACYKDLEPVAKKLLKCGAKVGRNKDKLLPLTVACEKKNMSVAQLLLIKGANPDAQEEDNEHYSRCSLPLHIAVDDKNVELVQLLLKHGANANVADGVGNTALHRAVERYKDSLSPDADKAGLPLPNRPKLILDMLLKNKPGESPFYRAVTQGMTDVVTKMPRVCGGKPNKISASLGLYDACRLNDVKLVDTLLKRGADPNLASSAASYDREAKLKFPLLVAVENGNTNIIKLLLNAGANVNMTNHEGKNAVCLAVETRNYFPFKERLLAIRLLLQHGANFNTVMPDGRTPMHLAVDNMANMQRCEDWRRTGVGELVQLMLKHGAMIRDSSRLPRYVRDRSLNFRILMALATFDGTHEITVDLFRAGAGFQLTAYCCNAVATSSREAKSICLCQAAVLAGYVPSDAELQQLQLEAAGDHSSGHLIQQLVNWLTKDREQVPSLLRQCRVAIRRQLSVATHFRTILPAIDELPLPDELALYLQFDGPLTEVQLGVKQISLNSERENSSDANETFLSRLRRRISRRTSRPRLPLFSKSKIKTKDF